METQFRELFATFEQDFDAFHRTITKQFVGGRTFFLLDIPLEDKSVFVDEDTLKGAPVDFSAFKGLTRVITFYFLRFYGNSIKVGLIERESINEFLEEAQYYSYYVRKGSDPGNIFATIIITLNIEMERGSDI